MISALLLHIFSLFGQIHELLFEFLLLLRRELLARCTKAQDLLHVVRGRSEDGGLYKCKNTRVWIYGESVLDFSTHLAKFWSKSGILASFGPDEAPVFPPRRSCNLLMTSLMTADDFGSISKILNLNIIFHLEHESHRK